MPPKGSSASSSSSGKASAKGQGSIASYFGGGGAKGKDASPSGGAGSSKKVKEPAPAQEAKQLTEKITVKGYTGSSPSVSPSKAPPLGQRPVESQESTTSGEDAAIKSGSSQSHSRYFANGSGKPSAKAQTQQTQAIEVDDDDEDEEELPPIKTKPRQSASNAKKRKATEDEGSEPEATKTSSKRGTAATAKAGSAKSPRTSRKAKQEDDDEEEEQDIKPAAKRSSAPTSKGTPKGSSKTQAIDLDDDEDMEDVKPNKTASKKASASGSTSGKKTSTKAEPDAPEETEEHRKAAVAASRQRAAAGASAPGSKEIPVGQPNCLAGLTFVFTGQLESMERQEASDLVKRYGAKVTGAPSSKTSFVIVGEGAGPSKIKSIEKNGIKTLSEDGLLDLIRSRGQAEPDEATMKKMKQEEEKIQKAAQKMDVAGGGASIGHKGSATKDADLDAHTLWTTKYAPTQLKDLVGNNAAVDRLKLWLEAWPDSLRSGFKKPGKNATNTFRAQLLSGPPGIGKTSAAHLCARLAGLTPIELNASDTRSKKLIEDSLKNLINNKSLDGWYGGGGSGSMTSGGITVSDKSVLILDEVDGMSGGDRGGIGAINQLIKKTKIPIILIANDRKSQKMKPFEHTAFNNTFSKPRPDSVRSRLQTIAFREGLKVDKIAMDQLIEAAQSDMRLVINMLSTWKLSQKAMSFDEGKALGAQNVKPGMYTPFSLYQELSNHGLWSAASKKSLNQKADLYFQDHSFLPLFVQENYVRQQPQRVQSERDEAKKNFKTLQLLTDASSSISDGDLIDGMIHGSQQHWSLMPVHAIASTIRPMSLLYGMTQTPGGGGGYGGGGYGPTFPSWLGHNSKQQRLSRATVELQTKMRLAASGSRWEVRETYAPYLFNGLIKPVLQRGTDGVEDVISLMDAYYLGLEDREAILELGVGENNGAEMLKKVPANVKSAFTRTYNGSNHPVAFQRGDPGSVKAKAKQLTGDAAPDVEEAVVDDEVFDESADEMDGDSDVDVGKDKMIKAKKPKAPAKSKAKSKAK